MELSLIQKSIFTGFMNCTTFWQQTANGASHYRVALYTKALQIHRHIAQRK